MAIRANIVSYGMLFGETVMALLFSYNNDQLERAWFCAVSYLYAVFTSVISLPGMLSRRAICFASEIEGLQC